VHVSIPFDEQPLRPAVGEQADPAGGPDPASRPTRRSFSPEYKLAVVAEYENAPSLALSSYLMMWATRWG
jgi:hypothetical protein